MKKLSLVLTATLILITLSFTPSSAYQHVIEKPYKENSLLQFVIEFTERQNMIEAQREEIEKKLEEIKAAELRKSKIEKRIQELTKHVNKTWYVFAGRTPKGWDCSGLVIWFYSDLQVKLEHSVSLQMRSGKIVKEPLPGDIISFSHAGSSRGYHNGIYIGEGLFIHSPRPGRKTTIISVEKYTSSTDKITYTRIDF
jgi:cell wall-associated NlpC family hydrolase